jgi:hypothetical protein
MARPRVVQPHRHRRSVLWAARHETQGAGPPWGMIYEATRARLQTAAPTPEGHEQGLEIGIKLCLRHNRRINNRLELHLGYAMTGDSGESPGAVYSHFISALV